MGFDAFVWLPVGAMLTFALVLAVVATISRR
jgi:heme exporter protein D